MYLCVGVGISLHSHPNPVKCLHLIFPIHGWYGCFVHEVLEGVVATQQHIFSIGIYVFTSLVQFFICECFIIFFLLWFYF